MDFLLPVWLNNQFLEQHLRQYFKDNDLKVVNFHAKSATGKGENFASSLYRLTLKLNKILKGHVIIEIHIYI